MKKISSLLMILLLMSLMIIGCSSNKPQKSEEELRAEVKAELEAEMNAKEGSKQEQEAVDNKEIKADTEDQNTGEKTAETEKSNSPSNVAIVDYDGDMTGLKKVVADAGFAHYKHYDYNIAFFGTVTNVEVGYTKYETEANWTEIASYDSLTNTLLDVDGYVEGDPLWIYFTANGKDYGVSYAKGDRAAYSSFLNGTDKIKQIKFSEPSNIKKRNSEVETASYEEHGEYAEPEEVGSIPSSTSSTDNALIKSNGNNYYKYKPNESVYFDIDNDGSNEEIVYDTVAGKLMVSGYEAIDIDTMFAEKDCFDIIKFNDKYNNKMNMIGIIDHGPSSDIVTNLYSVIEPRGEKTFASVGSVPGEIVTPSNYDEQNGEDFNYKAVLYDGRGIEAPVRLSILSNLQTWYGRNLFTYYTTYFKLIDNNNKYKQDYETVLQLRTKKDVKVYDEKNFNSNSNIIKGGQKVYFIATDNKEWVGMVPEDGTIGWVNVTDVTKSNFSGFTMFD